MQSAAITCLGSQLVAANLVAWQLFTLVVFKLGLCGVLQWPVVAVA